MKGFKDDTWINGIGDLFRRTDGTRWGVNLSIYPSRESGRDATSLSNAPVLVRKKIINQTSEYSLTRYEKSFSVTSTNDWLVESLGNCPALERRLPIERQQYCFVFPLPDGTKLYLPQFELARALFFHNGYLARTSLLHDALSNEFSVEFGETGRAIINVLDTCNCPVDLFNDYGYRRVLAWILIDADARASFESIGNLQMLDGYSVGQYRRWTFQFAPPPLEGARLHVKGHFDPESRALLVYEINGIREIPSNLPDNIEFFSPKFYSQVAGKGHKVGDGADRPSGHNVDDSVEASQENRPVLIGDISTEFSLARAVETSKISQKRRPIGLGGDHEGELSEASRDVSTEEQGPNGDLPSAEWDNLDEQTDDAHLYLNKFTSYFEMLKLLQNNHGCQIIQYPLRKLPSIGRCKKHILKSDGNPRCFSVTRVNTSNGTYVLLEVDTSDSKEALSTRVINARAISNLEESISEIEKRLLKASLSWPTEFLDSLFGTKNHFGIPHQKSGNDGVLTVEDVQKWALRFSIKIV